jgi:hypothetical protein
MLIVLEDIRLLFMSLKNLSSFFMEKWKKTMTYSIFLSTVVYYKAIPSAMKKIAL